MQDPQPLPGPSEPFAFDANAATLAFLRDGCATYGDVWAIPPTGGADSATGGGGLPIWVLNDPEAIHHVLTKRQPDYAKGVGFERVKMLLGDGLIVSDGDHWKQRRRMLQPAFSRPNVGGMRGLVDECIANRAHIWEEHAASGELLDISDEANRLGMRIILRAIFGDDLRALDERDGGNPFNLVVDTHERDLMFAMRFRQLWPIVREMVEMRRAQAPTGGPPRDFLGLYMAARDRETQAELDPPVWMFTRRALKDDVIAGRPIPAGTQILLLPFLLHRHPRYWENPESFDPSRFTAAGVAPHRSAYIPFSSGPRRCAGDVFALNTAVQEISWGVSRYHLTAPSVESPALDPGVNLRPLQPIRLFVHHAP